MMNSKLNKIYLELKSWPFVQALGILKKINYATPSKGYVLFETGYGPSGLPHIGTFGEVFRTIMVKNAFEIISDIPTRLICFSDDLDGLRKVPENIPNPAECKQYLNMPLSIIPDPFKTHESYAHNMNTRLCSFLDKFEFDYEFMSATHCYKSGIFNEFLVKVLEKYDAIMNLMIPTLGEERQQTYSPFLPICPHTNRVLQVPIHSINTITRTIVYKDPHSGVDTTISVLNGHCKLQWKPDLGMRWAAFDVDFEMYGKDHLVNGPLYTKICNILGNIGPHQMFFELFLDEEGKKISKSKGTGVTIDEWLKYAPADSLKLFMFLSPQKAKKLSFDIIPRYVDDYITYAKHYLAADDDIKRFDNPIYHIAKEKIADLKLLVQSEISYSLILNLVSACHTDDPKIIWQYIENFAGDIKGCIFIQQMVDGVIKYYQDFVQHHKKHVIPNATERHIIGILRNFLQNTALDTTAEVIQNELYRIARENNLEMREWFKLLYQVLIGAESGPRFGSFVTLYGIAQIVELIDTKLGVVM